MPCEDCEHDCSPYNIATRDAIPVALVCNLIPDIDTPDDPLCNSCAGTMCYKTEGETQRLEWPIQVWQNVGGAQQPSWTSALLPTSETVTFTMSNGLDASASPFPPNLLSLNAGGAGLGDFDLDWDQPLVGPLELVFGGGIALNPLDDFIFSPVPDSITPAFGAGSPVSVVWNDVTGFTHIDITFDKTANPSPGAQAQFEIGTTPVGTTTDTGDADTIEVMLVCNVCNDPPTMRYVDMSTGEEITDQDIIDSLYNCDIDVTEEEVCAIVGDETLTLIKRTFYASEPVDVFISANGIIVNPDSWVPGICDFEIVIGYVFDCLRFDNNLPINSDATFNDAPVGTNEIVFENAGVALLIRNEIEKARRVQAQEELHSMAVTPVVLVTDSGETYSFNPDALQSGTGSTLIIDESGIIAWGINQTDLVTEMQYSIFDGCDCRAVEVLQWIKDSNEVYLIDVFDITYDQETGQKISLLDEDRLLDFLTLGPFAGPCPETLQVMEVNPLCCNDDLVEGSPEIANQRLAWLDASDSDLMLDGGVPITGTTGEDVDEVQDKINPGVSPSFVVPANVAPGDSPAPTAPTFVEDGLNGLSVLDFDESDLDRLRLNTNNPTNDPFTLFYLVSASNLNPVGNATILAVGSGGDGSQFHNQNGGWQLSKDSGDPSFIFRISGTPGPGPGPDPIMIVQSGPFSPELSPSDGGVILQIERAIATEAEFFNGQFHLVTVSYDDTTGIFSAYFDGELRLQMDMTPTGFDIHSDYFRLFGNRFGEAYLSGQLAEMFFANSFLSAEETAEVNSYLICKWGIDPSLVAGGLGDLELNEPGAYTSPSPFVQIVNADGSITYRNTLNGQTFALPPLPGLSLCDDPSVESVDLRTHIWSETLCDVQVTVESITLAVVDTSAETVNRINGITGAVEETHAIGGGVDWTNGSFYDHNAQLYYVYDITNGHWHRYNIYDLAAGSTNLGAFAGDPIAGPNALTFGTFDPAIGRGYVGFQDDTLYEINPTLSTQTALPSITGLLNLLEAPSSLYLDNTGRFIIGTIGTGALSGTSRLYELDIATGVATFIANFPTGISNNSGGYDLSNNTGFYGIDATGPTLYRWTNVDASNITSVGTPGTAPLAGTMDVVDSTTSEEIITEFQRVYHKDTETGIVTTQDHDLDGNAYEIQGEARVCPLELEFPTDQHVGYSVLTLCDTDEEGCQESFLRHFNKTADGTHLPPIDTFMDGVSPYTVTGVARPCYDEPCEHITKAILVDLGDGETWTPAALPANHTVTGLTVIVVTQAADSSITDADATVITNIPAGLSMSWNTNQDYNEIAPPQSIFAGTGGRMIINMTLRDDT